ncbi:MAG: hypothetical protein U9R08_03460 [Nanoarchaeota archaeon]|nr:hypothetical protein [Nanoarchaeota archaeon]
MSNEEAQELGFNIYSPKEWKEWLQTSKVNRKRAFPRSGNGRLYAYHVMFWGAPKEVPKEARKGGQYTLFPGYDSNGKRYNLALYGVLDM